MFYIMKHHDEYLVEYLEEICINEDAVRRYFKNMDVKTFHQEGYEVVEVRDMNGVQYVPKPT